MQITSLIAGLEARATAPSPAAVTAAAAAGAAQHSKDKEI